MNKSGTAFVQYLTGDDEEYMSDGLPMDEKEDFAVEEHRRCTIVGLKIDTEHKITTESVPKIKSKRREVIVDVQEVEVDDIDDYINQQSDQMKDSSPFQNEEIKVVEEKREEVEFPLKIQLKEENLEFDAQNASEAAVFDGNNSPAIILIDSDNNKHHIVAKDDVIEEDALEQVLEEPEKSVEEQENSTEELENPEHSKSPEKFESPEHDEDHPDKINLSDHNIVEESERVEIKHDDKNGHDVVQNNNEQNYENHSNQEQEEQEEQVEQVEQVEQEGQVEQEVKQIEEKEEEEKENQESPKFESKDTMMFIGEAPKEPSTQEAEMAGEAEEAEDAPVRKEPEEEKDIKSESNESESNGQETPVFDENEQPSFKYTKDEELQTQQAFDTKALELLDQADVLKNEGNDFFKVKDYGKARSKYSRVFAYTKGIAAGQIEGDDDSSDVGAKIALKGLVSEEIKNRATNLERDVNNNMAMVYLYEKKWPKVIEKATASIRIDPSPKAYFRRGKAYSMKNNFEQAYKDFESGIAIR
jgi:tetratricopeptide (TPR) repeat protein